MTSNILAICQSGGEFVTNNDGSMSYSGGEAHAIDIDAEMSFSDLVSELSTMFNCNADAFSIKYFLPKNKRTLITISNDKDLRRMVNFHRNTETTDIYVVKKVENRIVAEDSGVLTNANTGSLTAIVEAKRQRVCNKWDSMITGVGQVFSSPKAFRDALHKYAIANSFMYRFTKNDGSRATAVCSVEDCPWRIHASRSTTNQEFVVKKINDKHTCGKELSKESRRLASQRWVASIIKDKLREAPDYKPKDIANDLEREYGLSLNYSQAWRGKFVAKKELHNSQEAACNQLSWFCERIIETNPGSVATLHTSDESRFCFFVAFHALLYGFEHGCRPLLFLDSFSLKANKRWKVLSATAVDGDNDLYPVAFSIVDSETTENWHWFLVQLKSAFTLPRIITFISSSQNGLEEELPKVFEKSFYGYSDQQLIEDFKGEMDSSWTQEMKDKMVDHLKRAIYACKVVEFNESIENIRIQSKELAEWVMDMKPESWSDAFFKGLRYGHYSSGAAEKFNEWVSTRYEPSVLEITDILRCNLMEMMYNRRSSSSNWTMALVPSANQKVQEEMTKVHTLSVVCSTDSVFEVSDESTNVVNIETRECTCRGWQVSGLPCMHALAVLERIGGCIYDYCSKYFLTECYQQSYSLSINPIPDVGSPVCADALHAPGTSPPPRTRRLAGRPKEKPAEPRISIKRALRCSKCQGVGHNKQTCRAQT